MRSSVSFLTNAFSLSIPPLTFLRFFRSRSGSRTADTEAETETSGDGQPTRALDDAQPSDRAPSPPRTRACSVILRGGGRGCR